jgi:hypothetical protein
MRRILALAALAASFALFIPIAHAQWIAAPLDQFASHFASRQVQVLCRSEVEDENLVWAWGYVNWPPFPPYTTYINDVACLGALAIDLDAPEVSDGQKVLGLVVLVHEAFHLRPVRGASNEGVTECRAFHNYDKGLRALGAEPEVVNRLMPRAIARHLYFVRRVPEYDLRSCVMPKRYLSWIGDE